MSLGRAALIVVDVQKDFCEGGALAVEGGNNVAERIADFIHEAQTNYATIVFTKDWHNSWPDDNGGHFSNTPDYVDSWPVHCEAHSDGSELHDALLAPCYAYGREVFKKGQGKPDYSGFQGVDSNGDDLHLYLVNHHVDEVHIVGIAGDHCVRATALDAKRLGFTTYILPDMVASVGGESATEATQLEVAMA